MSQILEQKEKPQARVSEKKKRSVEELTDLMGKKTIMIVSIKGLPDAMFQSIKKKLRDKAMIKVAKKSLVNFALEHSKNENLKELEKYVKEDCAILFSDSDAFELSGFLSDNKVSAKAKIGQIAPDDIRVEAGPTDLVPGPDISVLSSVGLKPKVESGKISILESRVLIKKGEEISEAKASVLGKLDITPFEIGLEPMVAFYEGKIYTDIKIDKKVFLEELENAFAKGLTFAVSIAYPNKETIAYILSRAGMHEKALDSLIKEEKTNEVEEKKEEPKAEENKSEDKTETK